MLHAGHSEAKRVHGLLAITASKPDSMLDAATVSQAETYDALALAG